MMRTAGVSLLFGCFFLWNCHGNPLVDTAAQLVNSGHSLGFLGLSRMEVWFTLAQANFSSR
jgi:hypothetical protein